MMSSSSPAVATVSLTSSRSAPVAGQPGGGDAGPGDDGDQQGSAGELGEQRPPGPAGHALAGLVARMIVECMAGAASWVNVTEASVNPAAASPSRYSARDSAPAMQPT